MSSLKDELDSKEIQKLKEIIKHERCARKSLESILNIQETQLRQYIELVESFRKGSSNHYSEIDSIKNHFSELLMKYSDKIHNDDLFIADQYLGISK